MSGKKTGLADKKRIRICSPIKRDLGEKSQELKSTTYGDEKGWGEQRTVRRGQVKGGALGPAFHWD